MNAERHPEHTISIDFIGTDIAEIESYRNRYTVKCSCGGMGRGHASKNMGAVDRAITAHLKDVGLDRN